MRNKKYRLEHFLYYDFQAITNHLTNMAEKGWLLDAITPIFWVYKRIAPKKIPFAISYFKPASQFNPEPTIEQDDYVAYCVNEGWNIVAQWHKVLIFAGASEHPTPIDTDDAVTLANIHAVMKGSYLTPMLVSLITFLLYAIMNFFIFQRNWIENFSSPSQLIAAALPFVYIFLYLTDSIHYFLWYQKAKKRINNEQSFPSHLTSLIFLHRGLVIVVAALLILFIRLLPLASQIGLVVLSLGLVTLTASLPGIWRRKKVSAASNQIYSDTLSMLAFVLVIAMGPILFRSMSETYRFVDEAILPITLKELEFSKLTTDQLMIEQSTFLLSYYRVHQAEQAASEEEVPTSLILAYTIVDLHIPALQALVMEDLTSCYKRCQFQEVDAAQWHADYVLQSSTDYIVIWGNRYVKIHLPATPTASQIDQIAKALSQQ